MRYRAVFRFLFMCFLILSAVASLHGQGGGLGVQGAGLGYNGYQHQPPASRQSAYGNGSEFIAVTGSSEIAVAPESLRLVFAVTSESETSNECATEIRDAINAIREGVEKLEIGEDKVVEDFIVIVPTYTWELKRFLPGDKKSEHLKEKHVGFRMQTNLHILCKDELQANAVMEVAFAQGVTEIISFDYWHSKLDELKQEATRKALKAAQGNAEILLSVFEKKPAVMNIGASSSVSFPQSQYKTIAPQPGVHEAMVPYSWRDYIKIRAHRPLTTFYAGSKKFADTSNAKPPMNPEIMINAEVTLTYESPVRAQRMQQEKEIAAMKVSDK